MMVAMLREVDLSFMSFKVNLSAAPVAMLSLTLEMLSLEAFFPQLILMT